MVPEDESSSSGEDVNVDEHEEDNEETERDTLEESRSETLRSTTHRRQQSPHLFQSVYDKYTSSRPAAGGESPQIDAETSSSHSVIPVLHRHGLIDPPSTGNSIDNARVQFSSISHIRGQHLNQWVKWSKGVAKAPDSGFERRPLAPGEWVVVGRGTYVGDPAQILRRSSAKTGEEGYLVLIVPRIAPLWVLDSKKHKRGGRFDARLFNPDEYDLEVPEGHVHRQFSFQGKKYSHGLLIKFFRTSTLKPIHCISSRTRIFFQKHPFSTKFPFPLPDFWYFESDELVDVVDDPSVPNGRGILQIADETNYTVDFADAGTHRVEKTSLRKIVVLGDYVEVRGGRYAGAEGLVVAKHGSVLAISRKSSRKGIDMHVDANSCKRSSRAAFHHSTIPWYNVEITIIRGMYSPRAAVVKDVKRGRYNDCLVLSVYIPELECSAEVEDMNFTLKGFTSFTPLWEAHPLDPILHKQYHIDRTIRAMQSGKVPWLGIEVGIMRGPFKGSRAFVRDVNRTSNESTVSGLEITVERKVFTGNGSNRLEKVYYDQVREWRTGKPLFQYRELTRQQEFYLPDEKFEPTVVTFQRPPLMFQPLALKERPGPVDWEQLLKETEEELAKQLKEMEEMEEYERNTVICRGDTPEPIREPGPVVDIWDPFFDDEWDDLDMYRCSSPAPNNTPPACEASTSSQSLPSSPDHWLFDRRLLNIPILVDIKGGPHDTSRKKTGVFVKPTLSPIGTVVARYSTRTENFDLPHSCIAKYRKRPNGENLMIVVGGNDEHIGNLVRVIEFFHSDKAKTEICAVCGVVSGRGNAQFTGEIFELSTKHLELVEETPQDRAWAKLTLLPRVQAAARKQRRPIRQLGEVNYATLTQEIQQQNQDVAAITLSSNAVM
ncbi:hypothetical protein E1B28_000054 [Marasmius oreades]|uniref:KOW domain-containing protein n=1 Tax=Marasmius oreades TaxID=181124 RepID=A0A9P7V0H3_9AGAR|nr:uncharacterized protein E1B28_000054 [Marasmius oreades]KAG7098080.1 hypothetical protein E1B28_000054 [Marasmius oreades]